MVKNNVVGDDVIVNVFVQEYHPSCNKLLMEGTNDFPYRLVGEYVSYEDNKLVVRQKEDDGMCCAPVMHRIFNKSRINLSINGVYLVDVDFIKTKSVISGDYLYTSFVLHWVGGG